MSNANDGGDLLLGVLIANAETRDMIEARNNMKKRGVSFIEMVEKKPESVMEDEGCLNCSG